MKKRLLAFLLVIMLFTTGCDLNINIGGNSSQVTEKEISSALSSIADDLSSELEEKASEVQDFYDSVDPDDFPVFDPHSYDNYEAPSYDDPWTDYDPLESQS